MSHYDLSQLLKKWEIAALTPEQTIGQILLNMQVLSSRIGEVERKLERLRRGQGQLVIEAVEPAVTIPEESSDQATASETPSTQATPETMTPEPLAVNIAVTIKRLIVNFHDGRALYVPIDWYPRLAQATAAERQTWELLDNGRVILWPKLNEKIGVTALLNGQRSSESRDAFEQWLANRLA